MICRGSLEGDRVFLRILSEEEEQKELKIQQELKQYIECADNGDYATAIKALEKAVDLGYKGDYSIIYKMYLSGFGNVEVDFFKGAEWLKRFYDDYKNRNLESDISAEMMVEVCYHLGVLEKELKHDKEEIDTRYIVEMFKEAVDFGSDITDNSENLDNTTHFLFIIGCCFLYGMLSTEKLGVKIEKNLQYAYKALCLAECFGDTTSIFLLGQMYENGLYVEKSKEYAGKLYLKAAFFYEEHAIKKCQKIYIDDLPWRRLDIWDNSKLPQECLTYVKGTSLYYVKTFSEFKRLDMMDIIDLNISQLDLYNYFSIIKNYMENIIVYLEINSNGRSKKSFLKTEDCDFDNNEFKKICKEITDETPSLGLFLDNVQDIYYEDERLELKINKIDFESILKDTICFVYRIAKIYDLEMQDIIADGYCGLMEAINKQVDHNNKNKKLIIMKYVLEYVTKNHYNQQIVKFNNPYLNNWYYLIYPILKRKIFDLEGPKNKEYINDILEEQCKILDKDDFIYDSKIYELYEKKYNCSLYQADDFFYATRIIESYESNYDKLDYEHWLGTYEEDYDMIDAKVDFLRILNTLNARQQSIIKSHYGMDCNSKTLQELSEEYKISRERIRQIKKNGLDKIKDAYKNGLNYKNNRVSRLPYDIKIEVNKMVRSKYQIKKHLRKTEMLKINSTIEYFYKNNIILNYIKEKDLEKFMIAYCERYEVEIDDLLEKICQIMRKLSNEKWLERKKRKVYSFRQTFIITRACMVYGDENPELIVSIIEMSLKNINRLRIEQKAISRTIKYVDGFIEKQYENLDNIL